MGYVPQIQDGEVFERETLDRLRPTAAAGPFRSQFGAVPYRDRHQPQTRVHEWLIKNVLTRGEQGMLLGASQTGKSFLAIDIAMAIARGEPWFGNKTRQGLVIYHAGESSRGVRDKRMPAYDRANDLEQNHDLPFVLLTLPLDLYSSDEDTNKLIAECQHWQTQYPDFPLELLVVDTFNAATPGADENAGKDVGSIRRRCKRIELALGCAVLLVHHKNAAGTKARGHSSMFADVENVLDISLVTTPVGKEAVTLKDVNGRKVREAVITKLKDGEDGKAFRFVLEGVRLGTDEDGDPITSCVIAEPDMGRTEVADHERAASGHVLSNNLYLLLQVITEAIAENGEEPAGPGIKLPNSYRVVRKKAAAAVFKARSHELEPALEGTEDEQQKAVARADAKHRQNWKRGCEALDARGYIKSEGEWMWRTTKRLPSEREKKPSASSDVTRFPDPVTNSDAASYGFGSSIGDWIEET